MVQQTEWEEGIPKTTGLSEFAKSLWGRLTKCTSQGESERIANLHGYNDAFDEALYQSTAERIRVKNFIERHDGYSLDTEDGKRRLVEDLYGVGDTSDRGRSKTTN